MQRIEIATPRGTARARIEAAEDPRAALVLGHGAGGGVDTADLRIAVEAAAAHGVSVALVEQPYRVAGRRAPAPAAHLDDAWAAVVGQLRAGAFAELPLITGGRSMGARVACRTAAAVGAHAVLCLAFPLHPPGRPDKDRLPELDAVEQPVLVVQGARDAFGMPPPGPNRSVVVVDGDHSLRKDRDGIAAAISTWLMVVLPLAAPPPRPRGHRRGRA